MVFSSTVFIFCFLPLTLLAYYLAVRLGKADVRPANAVLLLASLVFYSWGGVKYLLLLLGIVAVNYVLTLWMVRAKSPKGRKALFVLTVAVDIGNLLLFKYAGFFAQTLSSAAGLFGAGHSVSVPSIALPIGISFYTFQIISYVADVYRGDAAVQKNPFRLALYVTMFPQLIAGPIVRYTDVCEAMEERSVYVEDVKEGACRFIVGFAKKVFLANLTGGIADVMFGYGGELNTAYSWLGILCYALQIYYDFSAYSDMAIGIGRMLGFQFPENFDHPYVAESVQDFWRRWHISLSTWFRDYVYIPLGGSREGKAKTYRNLILVFFLTGFWHGAAWQFIVWGLYHGAFLILERVWLGKALRKLPAFFRRVYTMLVVLIGWVFFRADSLSEAGVYIANLFRGDFADFKYKMMVSRFTPLFWICLALGCLFAFADLSRFKIRNKAVKYAALLVLWIVSVLYLVGLDYNPFIYFRF